jgi:uncharacterized protein YndB with AHSA1/START domain
VTAHHEIPRVVRASREVAARPEKIFELVADPSQQPRWDGNDNLAEAAAGQRVRAVGEVFTMTTTKGNVRENHVVEFDEGRRIAWKPAERVESRPGICGGGSSSHSACRAPGSLIPTTGPS